MEILSKIRDFFSEIPFIKTSEDRLKGILTGPFLISLFFIFWEVPFLAFSSNPEIKILSIKALVQGADPKNVVVYQNNLMERIIILFSAWIFWVYAFPFISPFLVNLRERIISFSESRNNFDSYYKLKKEIDELKNELIVERAKVDIVFKAAGDLKNRISIEDDLYKVTWALLRHFQEKGISKFKESILKDKFSDYLLNDALNPDVALKSQTFSMEEVVVLLNPVYEKLEYAKDRIEKLENDWEKRSNR